MDLFSDVAEVETKAEQLAPGHVSRDEFRLIHFEERWRFVYIDLFQQPVNVSSGR